MRAALFVVMGALSAACDPTGKGADEAGTSGDGSEADATTPAAGETFGTLPIGVDVPPADAPDDTGPGTAGVADTADQTGADTAGADTGLAEVYCDPSLPLAEALDALQTPGDGKVRYCHSADGVDYGLIETADSACPAHEAHGHDIFPSTGCAP